eukprot:1160221-Pelagomonas_calceolata.AAC.2
MQVTAEPRRCCSRQEGCWRLSAGAAGYCLQGTEAKSLQSMRLTASLFITKEGYRRLSAGGAGCM